MMENLLLVVLVVVLLSVWKGREQARRIALLGAHLRHYQIERLMENLTDGYLRWLEEADPARREQVWGVLASTEEALAAQFRRFADEFARVDEASARISRIPFGLPGATRWMPSASFDARTLFKVHARGIEESARNTLGLSPKAKAYMMSAELFLMQHSCHWFCKSKMVASARLLGRHKTSYQQVLEAVSPQTRRDHDTLAGEA